MSQTMWGKIDAANNVPVFALPQLNLTTNNSTTVADGRANVYNNVTTNTVYPNVDENGKGVTTPVAVGVFGVSPAEMKDANTGGVGSVTVTAPGSGFTVRPTVAFSGGGLGASGATATATGKVVTVSLGGGAGAGGQDYAVDDVVTIAGGTGTSGTVNVLTVNATGGVLTVSINAAGSYTALPTRANNNPSGGSGTGLRLNLSIGVDAVTVTANGSGYTTAPTVAFGGAGGTGAAATAALRSEQIGVTSSGWVLRKAWGNRVQYETLVAMKSISVNATSSVPDAGGDDTQFPNV